MKCRQISDTEILKIEDAEFIIGIIPEMEWIRITSQLLQFKKMIEPLIKNPKAEATIDQNDPNYEKMIEANNILSIANRSLIKFGVRGHSGLEGMDGQALPFKKTDDGFADYSMVELYATNKLINKIVPAIISFSAMTGQDKKN